MIRDPVTDYRRALAAVIGWNHTARNSNDPRHERVAATCRDIARERAAEAHARPLTDEERASLAALEQQAGIAAADDPDARPRTTVMPAPPALLMA